MLTPSSTLATNTVSSLAPDLYTSILPTRIKLATLNYWLCSVNYHFFNTRFILDSSCLILACLRTVWACNTRRSVLGMWVRFSVIWVRYLSYLVRDPSYIASACKLHSCIPSSTGCSLATLTWSLPSIGSSLSLHSFIPSSTGLVLSLPGCRNENKVLAGLVLAVSGLVLAGHWLESLTTLFKSPSNYVSIALEWVGLLLWGWILIIQLGLWPMATLYFILILSLWLPT